MKRPEPIQRQMHRLVFIVCAVLAVVMVIMVVLLLVYNGQYKRLLRNVTTASRFNQEFKTGIDEKLDAYMAGGIPAEAMPVEEVRAARAMASELLEITRRADSRAAIAGVPELCQALEEKLGQLQRAAGRGDRLLRLADSCYGLTARIEEAIYNYLYCEALHLTQVQTDISRQVGAEILLFVFVAAALIAILGRYSVRLSRSVTQPIVELSRRAEDVIQGDLTVREPVRSNACEVRTLSIGMEEMIARLNAQMAEATEKQESLRRAELALLQAQISPHFLYNTLDTIIWLIEAGRYPAAVGMVSDLSDFFRQSLSRGRDIITLAEETRHVRSYLQIQQARYQDILDYTIEIDPDLAQVQIPKLTLQPLVENALYHGIKRQRGRGRISVLGRALGQDALLEIADDGAGMPQARLQALRRAMETGQRMGFGLATVHERLRLLYGPPYGLTLASRPGVGTTVTARIPRQSQEK